MRVHFYPWGTFKGYKTNNDQVIIHYKSFERLVLPDNDGNIKKAIMQYLESNI